MHFSQAHAVGVFCTKIFSFIAFLLCERVGYGLVRLDGSYMDLASVFVTFQRFLAGPIQILHAEERFNAQLFASEKIQIVMGQAQCKLMADSNAAGFFFRGFFEYFCDQISSTLNTNISRPSS